VEEFLKFINHISPISAETFSELRNSFRPLILVKNQFFVKEGVYAHRIGFLKKGIVRAFIVNDEGKEYTKQFFVGPSIIGAYTSLLTSKPAVIAQQALTDCEIIAVDYKAVQKGYAQFHDLERLGRKIAELYFLEKEQKEIEMAQLDADKRYLIMRDKFPSIEAMVPQYHVASYLGISPTQLSRIRKKMRDS